MHRSCTSKQPLTFYVRRFLSLRWPSGLKKILFTRLNSCGLLIEPEGQTDVWSRIATLNFVRCFTFVFQGNSRFIAKQTTHGNVQRWFDGMQKFALSPASQLMYEQTEVRGKQLQLG